MFKRMGKTHTAEGETFKSLLDSLAHTHESNLRIRKHPGRAAPLTAQCSSGAATELRNSSALSGERRHLVALLFREHHVKMLLHHWAI